MAVMPDRATVVDLLKRGVYSRTHQLGGFLLVALALAPLFLSDILLLKLAGAMFFAVFTISWDFVSGYTGYISFGHALFFGAAGYGSALLNVHLGLDPIYTIPVGVLCAILAGIIVGVPTLRLEGPYLSLITLIAPLLLIQIFVYTNDVTGGRRGLFGVETLVFSPVANFYTAFVILLVALAISLVLTRSNMGTIMKAISGDEELVAASGLNPAKYKIFAFVVSAGIGGLAGAVFTHTNVGSATPSLLLGLLVSANVIIAAVLGGMGTITGAAVGGFGFFMLRDFLRNIEFVFPVIGLEFNAIYLILLYILTMGVLIFMPDGFVPWLTRRVGGGSSETGGAAADGGRPPASRAMAKFRRQLRRIPPGEGGHER